jgi:pimeloyl-ACP methyl ester carboxylesterase
MFVLLLRWVMRIAAGAIFLVGIAAILFMAMLAVPVRRPPELKSIIAGVRQVDWSDLPPTQRFQARDGTELAYRIYEPAAVQNNRAAVLVHGSAGSSRNMHAIGKALAAAGMRAAALDIRGHGQSGMRGDIAYIGQLDDDLADAIAHFREMWPDAAFSLTGHSAGGGFALRTAGGPNGDLFERYVLLAPYLGYNAPTSRSSAGGARWVEADVPRILGLSLLRRMGVRCCEALPVIAFALPPEAAKRATLGYSYRLLANFGTELDYKKYLASARRPVQVISGSNDELMDASRYEEATRGAGRDVKVTLIDGVNHMGVVAVEPALATIVAALTQ